MSRLSKSLGIDTVFDIPMGMFEYNVRVVITEDFNRAKKYAAKIYEEPIDDDIVDELARGRLFRKINYIPILWIPAYPKEPRDYATLAHECVHAVATMFEWAQIPQAWQTEEVECHAVGHLVNEILKKSS